MDIFLKQVKIPNALYEKIEALAEKQGAPYASRTSRPETQAIIIGLLSRALEGDVTDVLVDGYLLLNKPIDPSRIKHEQKTKRTRKKEKRKTS